MYVPWLARPVFPFVLCWTIGRFSLSSSISSVSSSKNCKVKEVERAGARRYKHFLLYYIYHELSSFLYFLINDTKSYKKRKRNAY